MKSGKAAPEDSGDGKRKSPETLKSVESDPQQGSRGGGGNGKAHPDPPPSDSSPFSSSPRVKDPRKLFVGGLPPDMTDDEFRESFEQFGGEVIDARVMLDRETHRSRGFGFVTFADASVARMLLQMGDHADGVGRLRLRGKICEIKPAEPRGQVARRVRRSSGGLSRWRQSDQVGNLAYIQPQEALVPTTQQNQQQLFHVHQYPFSAPQPYPVMGYPGVVVPPSPFPGAAVVSGPPMFQQYPMVPVNAGPVSRQSGFPIVQQQHPRFSVPPVMVFEPGIRMQYATPVPNNILSTAMSVPSEYSQSSPQSMPNTDDGNGMNRDEKATGDSNENGNKKS